MAFDSVKDVRRFSQIIDVLIKHELGSIVSSLHLRHGLRVSKPRLSPMQLRDVCEELGGGFVKFGQLLSLRPDLLPNQYCDELKKLQDEVKPFPKEVAQSIVDRVFKGRHLKLGELIASASISEVYKAAFHGRNVAVKIRRPEIEKIVQEDLSILHHLAQLLSRHMQTDVFDPMEIYAEFASYSQRELDFLEEANAIERFHKNFAKSEIVIPQVFWSLTSSEVLVIEYLQGVKLSHAKLSEESKQRIARRYFSAMLKQVFEDGYFHADPHPGNIIILPKDKVAFIDFGIVGELEGEMRKAFHDLFTAAVAGDLDGFTSAFLRMDLVHTSVDRQELRRDLKDVLSKYYHTTLRSFNLHELFFGCLHVARKHHISLPRDFVLLGKAIITAQSVCLGLDPEFSWLKESQVYLRKMALSEVRPRALTKRALNSFQHWQRMIGDLPAQIGIGFDQISRGQKQLELIDQDLITMKIEFDRTVDRLILGLIVGALLVSASVLASFSEPVFFGLPVFSLLGLTLAGILGVVLLIHMLHAHFRRITFHR